MKSCKKEKILFWILVAALAVYTIKSIFVGADIDEAYGVTIGYRLVQGDRLMWDMWEPHQTSAIFTAVFIRLILLLTGGSLQFMTILLRVCFFVVQTGITWYVYKSFRDCFPFLTKWEGILLAFVYYVTTPKCIYVPEYSNLHMWFSTLFTLFLMQYFCKEASGFGKDRYLLLSGAMLACDVLSYPGMAVFYPACVAFFLLGLGRNPKQTMKRRIRALLLFTLPCVVGAGIFIGYLLSYMAPEDIRMMIPYILGDGSHKLSVVEKLAIWGGGIGEIVFFIAACGIAAVVLAILQKKLVRNPQKPFSFWSNWIFWWFVVQTVFQMVYWLDTDYNSGYPQLAYVAIPVFGIFCNRANQKKSRSGFYMILMAGLNFLVLNLFSNWRPGSLTVYLVIGLLGGLFCYREFAKEKQGEYGLKLFRMILILFILSEVYGRTLLIIGGDEGSSMLHQVRGISKQGVRGGIITSYMNSFRYNDNFQRFDEIVPKGGMVLYLGPSQFYYMMGDCRIASPSTISTPEYDESFAEYYRLHPERMPDVVVMESCYGDVSYFPEDSYIFTWIEEEYGATSVEEYPYVRVYRK